MDIVRFKGGLGNQMFDYAFYWALKQRGRDVGIDLSFFTANPNFPNPYKLTDYFRNIQFEPLDDSIFWKVRERWEETKKDPEKMTYYDKHLKERWFWGEVSEDTGCFRKEVFETTNCVFVGWWQTEKYFRDCRSDLLHEFEFSQGEQRLQELGTEFAKKSNTVSIHFRFANSYYEYINARGFHHVNVVQKGYYEKALAKTKELLGDNLQFIVFSDAMERAKREFSIKNAYYIDKSDFENYEDWYDMYLMSQCRCNIIPNSSFSWWAAWLNQRKDKIVIAPAHWEAQYDVPLDTPDIWAEGWIKL